MGLFRVDLDGGIPVAVQLCEQVKVAVALGTIEPGDLLPSIRQVETDLGVGRMLVLKAYQQLESSGIVRLVHGKGAVVTGGGRADGHRVRDADALIQTTLQEVRRRGLEPVSFSRLFHQRVLEENYRRPAIACVDATEVLAREMARQVEQAFGVRARALSIPELRTARRSFAPDVHVLVNYYHVEETRRALGRRRAGQIVPVSWEFAAALLDRLRTLPEGSRVLLLFYQAHLEQPATRLAIEHLVSRVHDRRLDVTRMPMERVGRLESLRRARYRAIVVSNQLWDDHEPWFERHAGRFWRLATQLDERSLRVVTERLGVVL